MELKIGDKVRVKNRRGAHWSPFGGMDKYMGQFVTVRGFSSDGDVKIVEDRIDNCGFGWFWDKNDFEPIYKKCDKFILEIEDVIHKDGQDFYVAKGGNPVSGNYLDSLEKQEKSQDEFYNGKIVCIESAGSFELGKIYKVVDGFIAGPVKCGAFKSIEDLNNHFHSKFAKLIEED